MFHEERCPTGHFTLAPIPMHLFGDPSPYGSAALFLNKFPTNQSALLPVHKWGIKVAATQGMGRVRCCEVYGVTDRAGSEAYNLSLSAERAREALKELRAALRFSFNNIVDSKGLGERFMAEYYEGADNTRAENFRGVVCYLWESFDAATDPFLKVNIAFAAPPLGGGERGRSILAPLHMGRLRTLPRSPFA